MRARDGEHRAREGERRAFGREASKRGREVSKRVSVYQIHGNAVNKLYIILTHVSGYTTYMYSRLKFSTNDNFENSREGT